MAAETRKLYWQIAIGIAVVLTLSYLASQI